MCNDSFYYTFTTFRYLYLFLFGSVICPLSTLRTFVLSRHITLIERDSIALWRPHKLRPSHKYNILQYGFPPEGPFSLPRAIQRPAADNKTHVRICRDVSKERKKGISSSSASVVGSTSSTDDSLTGLGGLLASCVLLAATQPL
jgi:hypothetical protein